LHDLGYEKKDDINPKIPASAAAQICADALAWAYSSNITPDMVAEALRNRRRSYGAKAEASKLFDERFPDAGAVIIMK
jgi:hypothetical protein